MDKVKAFPNNRSEGMDLRDYFAAKVMQGFMQASASLEGDEEFSFEWAVTCGVASETQLHGGGDDDDVNKERFRYTWARYYAEEAYIVADAMMKAREIKND
jgi:hypothetical protein